MDFRTLAEAFEKIEATSGRIEMTNILVELLKKAKKDEVDKLIYLLQGRIAPHSEGLEIGLGYRFVEQAIVQATGHTEKEVQILYRKLGDHGLVAEELMKKKKQRAFNTHKMDITYVFERFHKIAKTTGTGSQQLKIKTLVDLFNNATPLEARYIARIPIGQLRLGIGDPTVLDALSIKEVGDKSARENLERAYNVSSDLALVAKTLYNKGLKSTKRFEINVGKPLVPALCERLSSAEDIIERLGKCLVQGKYDGIRLQIHKDGDKIMIFSRRLENITHMFPEVVETTKKLKVKSLILDSEVLAYNEKTGEFYPFQITTQRKRKHGIAEKAGELPVKVFCFDILYKDGKELTSLPQEKRWEILNQVVPKKDPVLMIAESIVTDDPKKLNKYFEDTISRGLEGIVAKDLKAPYMIGERKFSWIKLKRSYKGELNDTLDLVIVGFYTGSGQRAEFGFGGFLGAVYDEKEDMFKTITRVGSGFSEDMMRKFKQILTAIKTSHKPARVDSIMEPDIWVTPKYVVTVRADEITESTMHTAGKKGDGTGYALRFPRMIGDIREDKRPEDATTVSEIIKMFKEQKRSTLKG